MKKNLTKNPTLGKIQKVSSEEVVTSFYGLDGAASAIKASNFDIMEEITMVIQHTRDPDPKVSLPALRHFRSLLKELVLSNGMIGTVKQTETLPDTNVSRTMSSSTLLTNLRSQNGQIQDQVERKHEILPAHGGEKEDKKEGSKKGRKGRKGRKKNTSKSNSIKCSLPSSDDDNDGNDPSISTSHSGLGNL